MPKELKLTFKELLAHKKLLIIIALTGVTGALCKGSLSLFIKAIMDAAENDPYKLKSMIWVGVGLSFGIAISRYIHIFLMNFVAENVSQTLREKLQSKFMRLNLKFYNTYAAGSGGLISRTMNDIKIVHDGLRLFADLFSAPLTFVFYLTSLFILDAKLTLYILILLPIIVTFLKKISKSIRKYSISGVQQLELITSTIKESLDGVRTIQAFNLEDKMQTKLKTQGFDFVQMRKKIHALIESMGPITEFIATFLILAVIFYFSERIANHQTTYGTLVGFIAALMQMNEPIKKFQEAYVRVQETRVSAERVFEMIEEDSEVPELENPQAFPQSWNQIEYRNVDFSFGNDVFIKNFNLTIKKGQVVALVGSSGSGKTTVANLLARFYDPQSGGIFIQNQDIKNISLTDLRKNIGLVSQDVFLFSDTVENNILAGAQITNTSKVESAAQAAHAHEFISQLPQKYQTSVGERGGLLSGGEKQRVGIARALYKDAPLLILDEATSALDSVSEVQVQKGLDTLMKGRTTLVIAHRLSTVQTADLILVMVKGQIVEQGTHEELIKKNGEYNKLFSLQTRA